MACRASWYCHRAIGRVLPQRAIKLSTGMKCLPTASSVRYSSAAVMAGRAAATIIAWPTSARSRAPPIMNVRDASIGVSREIMLSGAARISFRRRDHVAPKMHVVANINSKYAAWQIEGALVAVEAWPAALSPRMKRCWRIRREMVLSQAW